MNAKEQLSHYRNEIKALNERRAGIPVGKLRHFPFDDRSWFIAQDILNRLEMGIEKFEQKAFPLTDAQVALVEKIIKAERERLNRAAPDVEDTPQKTETGEQASQITPISYVVDEDEQREAEAVIAHAKAEGRWGREGAWKMSGEEQEAAKILRSIYAALDSGKLVRVINRRGDVVRIINA